MSGIAPLGPHAGDVATPGVWWVDASAQPNGDGSMDEPFIDLQDTIAAAYDDGSIRLINVYPGTYTTNTDAARSVSVSTLELDHVVVRSIAGREATILVAGTGLGFPVAIMREDATLEGFTLVPEATFEAVVYSDSGTGLLGTRSTVRDVVFDSTGIVGGGGTCFSVQILASGTPSTDNVLEDFEVRGAWLGFGIGSNTTGGRFHLRRGIVDDDATLDPHIVSTGAVFPAVNAPPAELYVSGLHVPAGCCLDAGYHCTNDGELTLDDASVDGAVGIGLHIEGTGIVRGSGVRVVNSTGNDVTVADTGSLLLRGGYFDPAKVTVAAGATISNGAPVCYSATSSALHAITGGPTTINGMTLTPAKGAYRAAFDCTAAKSAGGSTTMTIGIYKNGVLVTDSDRDRDLTSAGKGHVGTQACVTANGTDAFTVRATNAASVDYLQRTLTMAEVTPR